MTIGTHQPELEALIEERMRTGAFASVEDVLLQAALAVEAQEVVPIQTCARGWRFECKA
jgi:hypothetical protein